MSQDKKVFNWTREIIKDLIHLYESQRILYATKSKEYKNKIKRAEAINCIKNQLKDKYIVECKMLTHEDITKKIHILRTQYLKENGLLKKFLSSGASTDAYIPKLWCFDLLQFLNEGQLVAESTTNLQLEETDIEGNNNDDDVIYDGSVEDLMDFDVDGSSMSSTLSARQSIADKPSTVIKKNKRQLTNSNLAVTTLLDTAVKSLEVYQQKKQRIHEEDDIDLFARSIAAELQKIKDTTKLREIKKLIYSQVIDAQD